MKTMRGKHGFSLIELLTVIAIIAILAGIIFPVMARVKEEAKKTSCMTNLMQIAQAVKMYQLDNRKYPESIAPEVQYDTSGALIPLERARNETSLYPEYVKTIRGLHCGATPSQRTDAITTINWRYDGKDHSYYVYSSYDVYCQNPDGTGTGWPNLRYYKYWAPEMEPTVSQFNPTPGETESPELIKSDYKRQLRFKNPADNTMVTWCSYHAHEDPKGQVLVVYLDGHAEKRPCGEMEGNIGYGGGNDNGSRFRIQPKKE